MAAQVRFEDAIAVIVLPPDATIADDLPGALEEALGPEPQHVILDLTQSQAEVRDADLDPLVHAHATADCAGARFTVLTRPGGGHLALERAHVTVSESWEDAFERVGPRPVSAPNRL